MKKRQRVPIATVLLAGAMTISVLIYVLRRPDQFLNPQIWNEEGLLLQSLSEQGILATVFFPFAGTLNAPTNLAVVIAGTLNLAQANVLLYWFAVFVFVFYLALWSIPASKLKPASRALIMLLTALIPTDPETFGVGLYTFWWMQLFVIPMFFWDKAKPLHSQVIMVIACLSGPVGCILSAIYLSKRIALREAISLRAFFLPSLITLAQFFFVVSSGRLGISTNLVPLAGQMANAVGMYFTFGIFKEPLPLIILVGLTVISIIALKTIKDTVLYFKTGLPVNDIVITNISISAALAVSLALAAIAGGIGTNPLDIGPRYFFFSFQILSIFLVFQLAVSHSRATKVFIIISLLSSQFGTLQAWDRHHDDLAWGNQILKCSQSTNETYEIYVHYIGSAKDVWDYSVKQSLCR
ncbi:hypothetical protein MCEMIE24B_00083 [Microbacteriaceae bacterium]